VTARASRMALVVIAECAEDRAEGKKNGESVQNPGSGRVWGDVAGEAGCCKEEGQDELVNRRPGSLDRGISRRLLIRFGGDPLRKFLQLLAGLFSEVLTQSGEVGVVRGADDLLRLLDESLKPVALCHCADCVLLCSDEAFEVAALGHGADCGLLRSDEAFEVAALGHGADCGLLRSDEAFEVAPLRHGADCLLLGAQDLRKVGIPVCGAHKFRIGGGSYGSRGTHGRA
jgi:hypothetical protein